MASTVTLLQLRDRIRKRADAQGSTFWTDAEIDSEINVSLRWLYNLLVECFGGEYFRSTTTDASVANTATYALPADFFKLLSMDVGRGASPTRWFTVKRFQRAERNTRPDTTGYLTDYRYRLEGNNYRVIPTPATGLTFQVAYVPTMTALSADGDTFDSIHGYEEWAVLDVIIKILASEESEIAHLVEEKRFVEQLIRADAESRNLSEPAQVVDVESVAFDESYDGVIY